MMGYVEHESGQWLRRASPFHHPCFHRCVSGPWAGACTGIWLEGLSAEAPQQQGAPAAAQAVTIHPSRLQQTIPALATSASGASACTGVWLEGCSPGARRPQDPQCLLTQCSHFQQMPANHRIYRSSCLWLHEPVPAQAFGLKASALGRPNDKVPPWLLKWAALVLGWVQQERQLLPAQLLALRLPLVHYTPLTAAAEAKGVGWLRTKPAGTASRPQPRALGNLISHCGSGSAAGARRPVTAAAEARRVGSVQFGGIDVLDAAAAPCMLLLRSPCTVLATQVGVQHRPRASQSRSRRSQPMLSACRRRGTLPQAYPSS